MTYNIRYANDNPGEEWILRKDHVAEMIRFHKPDIFGIQEAILEQVVFILEEFPGYQLVGVGREDGKNKGEFSPLLISNEFIIEDYGTFWLSETPDIPSFGWDAAFRRIATWAIVKHKLSEKSFFLMNTHLDHRGEIAREESVKLLVKKIETISRGLPAILTGDFNFANESPSYKLIINSKLVLDSQSIAKYKYGTNDTFNRFDDNDSLVEKIDFIFVTKQVNVIHHAVIGDKFDGKYPSDHMPVIIDFLLE